MIPIDVLLFYVVFFPPLCSKNDQTFEPLEPLKNQKVVFGRRNDL